MARDLLTAFLIAIAAASASELLVSMWSYFWARHDRHPATPAKGANTAIIAIGIVGAALIATFYFGLAGAVVATVRSFVS